LQPHHPAGFLFGPGKLPALFYFARMQPMSLDNFSCKRYC
jgi:hypothetical protein